MAHESLRPHVNSLGELYALLADMQAQTTASLGRRALCLLTLLVVGFVAPGAVGQAGLCLAAMAFIACMWTVGDHVGRNWFMHAVSLHDLMGLRYDNADLQMAEWAAEAEARANDGEA